MITPRLLPNETTLKAMHEVEQGTDLQGYSDLDEMFQELGLSQGYQTNAAYYSQQQEDWKHADQL